VVTAVAEGYGFFMQDLAGGQWSGVYVYDSGTNSVAIGDLVSVTGTYIEYYDLTEIQATSVTVDGTADEPLPEEVEACDIGTGGSLAEAYESVLVQVSDVTVTTANPDGSSDYGEFEIEGCLRVNDYLYADLARPDEGDSFASITGVLDYSYSEFKLEPRFAADLVE
jgi:predicted extracellular nuclease